MPIVFSKGILQYFLGLVFCLSFPYIIRLTSMILTF